MIWIGFLPDCVIKNVNYILHVFISINQGLILTIHNRMSENVQKRPWCHDQVQADTTAIHKVLDWTNTSRWVLFWVVNSDPGHPAAYNRCWICIRHWIGYHWAYQLGGCARRRPAINGLQPRLLGLPMPKSRDPARDIYRKFCSKFWHGQKSMGITCNQHF